MNSTFHILKRKGERKIKKETELACEIYRQAERAEQHAADCLSGGNAGLQHPLAPVGHRSSGG